MATALAPYYKSDCFFFNSSVCGADRILCKKGHQQPHMQQRWMLYSAGTTTSQHLRTFYGNYNHTRTVWMCAHTWLNAERINSLSWAWRGTASGHRWPTGAHHLRCGAFNRAAVTANEADLLHSFFFFCIPISQRHHLKSVVLCEFIFAPRPRPSIAWKIWLQQRCKLGRFHTKHVKLFPL